MASKNGYKLLKKTNEDPDFSTSKPGPSSETQADDQNDKQGRIVSGPGILEPSKVESLSFDERSKKKWTRSCPQISTSEEPISISTSGSSNDSGRDLQSSGEESGQWSSSVGDYNQQQLDGGEGDDNQQEQDGGEGGDIQQQLDGGEGEENQQQLDGGEGDENQQEQDGGEGGDIQQQLDGGEGDENQQQQLGGGVGDENQQEQDGGEGGDIQQQLYGGEGGNNQQQLDGGEHHTSRFEAFKKSYFSCANSIAKSGVIYGFQAICCIFAALNIALGITSLGHCRDGHGHDRFSAVTIIASVCAFVLIFCWVCMKRRSRCCSSFCLSPLAKVVFVIPIAFSFLSFLGELVLYFLTEFDVPYGVFAAVMQALNSISFSIAILIYFPGVYVSATTSPRVMPEHNGYCRHPDSDEDDNEV